MKVDPMDWPARPDLEATIAQQQARLTELERMLTPDGQSLPKMQGDLINQQQARIEELKLALDKADPLDPSFLRYLELEQQLQAERERADALQREKTELMNLGVQYALEHRDELARHEDMWVGKWQDLHQQLERAEEESDKWFAIAAAEQDVKALLDRNVKLREWLESSDGMMANYERLAAKYRDELQAERERVVELEASQSAIAWAEQLHRAQIAETDLQAEREKSASLEVEIAHLKLVIADEPAYQREEQAQSERLEALAGLATQVRPYVDPFSSSWWNEWCARYDALATQAPEAGQ